MYVAVFRNVNLGRPKSPRRAQLEGAFAAAGAGAALCVVYAVDNRPGNGTAFLEKVTQTPVTTRVRGTIERLVRKFS